VKNLVIPTCLFLAATVAPASTYAQDSVPTHEPYRKWDASSHFAVLFGQGLDDAVIPTVAWSAALGRYWTPHFKTSFSIVTAGQTTLWWPESTLSDLGQTTTRPAGVSGSVAWQFYENVLAHPYVAAGVQAAWASDAILKFAPESSRGWIPIEQTPFRTKVRPIAGVGFKSYFANGRAFMQPELRMVVLPDGRGYQFGPDPASQRSGITARVALQIGAGFDF
jgi:hypothetical protein